MKLNFIEYNKAALEAEENETTLTSFLEDDCSYTELIIPEGIDTIRSDAFDRFSRLNTLHFPRSLRVLENGLFHRQSEQIRVNYAGKSADFISLAKPSITQEYVPGAYDHYPYYSDYGASYRDVVSAFDTDCEDVEVYCEEDGVYLYYGKLNKKPDDELPLSREDRLAREEKERKKTLSLYNRINQFFKDAGVVALACQSKDPRIFPCFGTFDIYEDKIYLAIPGFGCLRPYIDTYDQPSKVAIQAIVGDNWINVDANAVYEEKEEVKNALAERFPIIKSRGYELIYLEKVWVLYYGPKGVIGSW